MNENFISEIGNCLFLTLFIAKNSLKLTNQSLKSKKKSKKDYIFNFNMCYITSLITFFKNISINIIHVFLIY